MTGSATVDSPRLAAGEADKWISRATSPFQGEVWAVESELTQNGSMRTTAIIGHGARHTL